MGARSLKCEHRQRSFSEPTKIEAVITAISTICPRREIVRLSLKACSTLEENPNHCSQCQEQSQTFSAVAAAEVAHMSSENISKVLS